MPSLLSLFAVSLLFSQLVPEANSARLGAESGERLPSMIAEAQEAQLSMNQGMRRTVDILREARQGSDIVRMSCVNEKLTVVKGIIRISEDAFRGLTQAASHNDVDQASYEHNKIMTSRDRVNSLTVQAVNCVGSSATATGDTQTQVDEAQAIQNRNILATKPVFGDSREWQDGELPQNGEGSAEGEGSESGEVGQDSTGGGLVEGSNAGSLPSSGGGAGPGVGEPPRPPASAGN
jgi:hypothetical protein